MKDEQKTKAQLIEELQALRRLQDAGGLQQEMRHIVEERLKDKLIERSNFIDKIIESSALSTWISDEHGTLITANPACLDFFGATAEEVVGKYNLHQDTVIKDQGFAAEIDRVFDKGEVASFVIDYDLAAVDHVEVQGATHKIVKSIFTPILDSRKKVSNVIVQTIDLTDIIEAKQALEQSEGTLRAILDSSPDIITLVDGDGIIRASNRVLAEKLGTTQEKIVGQNVFDFFPDSIASSRKAVAEKVFRTGEPQHIEDQGLTGIIESHVHPVFSSAGEISAVTIFARDITERKQAEQDLTRFSRVLERSLDEIYIFDSETLRFIEVNLGARTNLGYTLAELQRLTPLDIKPEITPARFAEIVEPLRSGAKPKTVFTTAHQRKDGSLYPVEVHLQLIPEEPPVFVAIIQDITDRVRLEEEKNRLEEQIRQSQKMESIGQLAGGVAHDFNNLLTVINNYADIVFSALYEGDPLKADVAQIREAGQRAATLTRQLLAFSRKQILETRILDLNEVVHEIEKMLTRLLGEHIEFSTVLANDLDRIKADPGQVEQVLMNLAVNARDAMPQGGKLTIETANVVLDEAYASTHADTIVGRYVMLAVTDSGSGIATTDHQRIFEPFFTTKDEGKGTGLGLATVYGIIKQSGGNIWVYSTPGQGTTFKVYLPRADDQQLTPRPGGSVSQLLGTETVLLVEDDESVRKLALRILSTAGYTVIPAANGGEALRVCEQQGTLIHLVLTDVIMPKMSGQELANRLAVIRPDLKVLFMSGYTDDAIANHGVLDEATRFIGKPFTTPDLLEKVRMVLDS